MGVKDAADYRYYQCPNDKCWLGPYPKEKWGQQPIITCRCDLPFFEERQRSNGVTEWQPTGQVGYNHDTQAMVWIDVHGPLTQSVLCAAGQLAT